MEKIKRLYLDLESSPLFGTAWGRYEQNLVSTDKESYILCCGLKWEGKKTEVLSLPDFKNYTKHKDNDKLLIAAIWKYLDEADIVIGHNLRRFDSRKLYARFAFWKLPPPRPFKIIDTLSIARKHFAFSSNKLDDLAKHLGLGAKVEHKGFALWQGCMAGNMKDWASMTKYCSRDVDLLPKLLKRLLPFAEKSKEWMPAKSCAKCNNSTFQKRGFGWSSGHRYQILICKTCNRRNMGAIINS